MMRSFFVLMMPVLCLIAHKATAMQENYQVGQSYSQSGITLGNPTQIDDGFLQRNKDTSHLQNMNDTTLSEQGADAYQHQSIEEESSMRSKSAKQASDNMATSGQKAQSSHQALKTDHGNLLKHSEVAKIDATQEHKIDPKDQLYKASFAIESDPLNKTGGTAIKTSNKITKTTDHTCEEGVQFTVDVINQLTYVPPPWIPSQDKAFDLTSNRFWRTEPWHGHIYFNLPYTGVLKSIEVILQGNFPHKWSFFGGGGGYTHYWLRIQPFHPSLIDHYHNPSGIFSLKFNNWSYALFNFSYSNFISK